MLRIPAAVALGFPYHFNQRGNYQQPVFEEDKDFALYNCRRRIIARGSKLFGRIPWLAAHVVKLVSED